MSWLPSTALCSIHVLHRNLRSASQLECSLGCILHMQSAMREVGLGNVLGKQDLGALPAGLAM